MDQPSLKAEQTFLFHGFQSSADRRSGKPKSVGKLFLAGGKHHERAALLMGKRLKIPEQTLFQALGGEL